MEMKNHMGNTTDVALKASHTEVPLSELALPPEQRTPEVRALYEKAILAGQTALASGPHAVSAAQVEVAAQPAPQYITYDLFKAVEMVVGRVVSASPVPKADKLIHLVVDFGASRTAVNIVAGILKSFPDPTVLLGRTFAFVTNLPPRPMKGVESHGMLLCAVLGDKVIPVEVPGAEPGARLS